MKQRVLVIDDFDNVRKSIRAMLVKLGVETVVEATHGIQALRIMRDQRFDVILCDFNLGKGMDGQQLLEEAREQRVVPYTTLYILITAETSREMVMGALEDEPDDYLAKPFAFDTLRQRWEKWQKRRFQLREALIAKEKGEDKKLLDACKSIAEKAPRYRGWAQRQMSDLFIKMKAYDPAKKLLGAILEKRDVPWAQLDRSRLHILEGEFEEAKEMLEEMIRFHPDMTTAYDLLAECYHALKEPMNEMIVLKKAVLVSPRNLKRQRLLAEVSEQQEEYKVSRRAFRSVISLSENSSHEDPRMYQRMLNVMGLEADESEDVERKRLAKEINLSINKMNKKYSDNEEVKATSAMFSLMNVCRVNPNKAPEEETLKRLFKNVSDHCDFFSKEMVFYTAKFMFLNNRFSDGDALVNQLKHHPDLNDDFLHTVEEMQNEPISGEAKKKAQELNQAGRSKYEKGNLDGAMYKFREAMQFSPRNPGLILNYVQCAVTQHDYKTMTDDEKKDIIDRINRLSFVDEDHPQFKRLSLIRQKLNIPVPKSE